MLRSRHLCNLLDVFVGIPRLTSRLHLVSSVVWLEAFPRKERLGLTRWAKEETPVVGICSGT